MLVIGAGGGPEHNNSNPALSEERFQTDLSVEIQKTFSERKPKTYKRIRHPDFLRAQKFVTRFVFSLEDIGKYEEEIMRCAGDYLDDVDNRVIVLQHKEVERIKVLRYRTRFDPDYGDKVLAKINQLKIALNRLICWYTHLILTFDPKALTSLYDYKIVFGENLSKLMLDLHRHGAYRYFVISLELQKNGNLHAHILLIGSKYIPLSWLKPRLKALGFGEEKIKAFKGTGASAMAYILKYITKSLVSSDESLYNDGGDDPDQQLFRLKALLWALHLRQIRLSKSCLEVLRGGHTRLIHHAEWIYVGIRSKLLVEDLIGKINNSKIVIDPNIIFEILSQPPPA